MVKIERFSEKQLLTLSWWCPGSGRRGCDAVICDGAVRSGKTLCLSLSFILWATARFNARSFALCGKTVSSLRRNVVFTLLECLGDMGFRCDYKVSHGSIEISKNGVKNTFYLFGGRDEGSAALIQGVTLAGVLFDEAALMPRSFVEQALARCSVEGAKFWFNCNPEHPGHWFHREWIEKREQKNALYIHFEMKDNPSLSPKVLARYQRLYTGVFYERYVLGKWVAAHGAVYPMFSGEIHVISEIPKCARYFISCDYGTVNPASFGLWGENGGKWVRLREYYHDSRREGVLKTDEDYCDELEKLAGGLDIEGVIVDPSAASFILCLRRRGRFRIITAQNGVMDGIRMVSAALKEERLFFHESCRDCIREFSLYRWNMNSPGDAPVKENDHAMDDMRYFVSHIYSQNDTGFCAMSLKRG